MLPSARNTLCEVWFVKEADILVGKILGAHGLRGELKLEVLSSCPTRFDRGNQLWSVDKKCWYEVAGSRPQGPLLLLKLLGVDDRTAAEEMGRGYLAISREQLPQLPPGEYYHFQLVGLAVRGKDGPIGRLKEVLSLAANDVYVVERPGKKDLLLPALRAVVKEVNLEEGFLFAEIPPGLDDEADAEEAQSHAD